MSLGELVVSAHERLAVAIAQQRSFAAHGFADQEGARLGVVQAGGMELDELHIGDGRAGAVGHGDPVPRRDVRVAGVEVDLAAAPRGQEHDGCLVRLDRAGLGIQHVGTDDTRGLRQAELVARAQIDRQLVGPQLDVRVRFAALHQTLFDLLSGEIGRVQYATLRVATLSAQVVATAGLALVEMNAQRDERRDGLGAVLHHEADGLFAAQPRARPQRVLYVRFERVRRGHDGRDPALRVVRGRLIAGLLGDHHDRAVLRRTQREGEAGDAAPKNQEVTLGRHRGASLSGPGPGGQGPLREAAASGPKERLG
jgi:hypothetical protein